MNLGSILTRRRFAIFASIVIAASFWLSTTAVNSCSSGITGSTFQCKNDVLVVFLIEHKKWPYQDVPFVGYWDSFDNKFTSFAAEPYFGLLLAGVFAYLVWLRAIVYVEKKSIRLKASISHLECTCDIQMRPGVVSLYSPALEYSDKILL